MSEFRNNVVALIFGKRGSGKTHYTLNGLIPSYRQSHPGKKILVVDTLDHPAYRAAKIPRITPDMIRRWKKPSIYRCFGSNMDEIFLALKDHGKNMLVIWEDASKYLGGRLDPDVKSFVMDTKQKDVDLLFMFHGFGFCPPQLLPLADMYTIFKCSSPASRRSDIPDYQEVFKVWESVQKSKEKYPVKTVQIY